MCKSPVEFLIFRSLATGEIQMDGRFAHATSGLASTALKALTVLTNALRKAVAVDARPYRPEDHYMRGPGPKWRAAHARSRDPAVR